MPAYHSVSGSSTKDLYHAEDCPTARAGQLSGAKVKVAFINWQVYNFQKEQQIK